MEHTYVTAYQTFSFQFLSGMPSGIKTTNDVESIVNAAMLTQWCSDFAIEPLLLATMGDDAIIIYDIPIQ